MTQTRTAKRRWIRGALLVATLAACQAGGPDEPKDSKGNEDVAEALAALPEAEVLQSSADGVRADRPRRPRPGRGCAPGRPHRQ